MNDLILVPVKADALYLTEDTPSREGLADFTRLPYSDGGQDHNPDVACIAEEILTPPFQDKNLVLPAGVHLHWYLPGVLTKPMSKGDGDRLPPAPDRWVVTRFLNEVRDKSWLVESDFLSTAPLAEGLVQSHVPYYDGNPRGQNQPYRFLGRAVELGAGWNRAQSLQGPRIQYLTATGYEPQPGASGYAEPTFAAYYPHCNSVFGFHDPDIRSLDGAETLAYQVLGFYGRAKNDYLSRFLDDFIGSVSAEKDWNSREFNRALKEAIEDEFLWRIDFDPPEITGAPPKAGFAKDDILLPAHNLYTARVEFASLLELSSQPAYQVAAGNTGTEALSAFLAGRLSADKTVVEDQLEAVQFTARLNNRNLDIGAKFREARHEKGFRALPGETLWTVVLRSVGVPSAETEKEYGGDPVLSAEDLHRVNSLQAQYEKAGFDLDALQKQLYADWNKYMLCAYPPADSMDAYPDLDEVMAFIEQRDIQPIEALKRRKGQLSLRMDGQDGVLEATAGDSAADSLAARLAAEIGELLHKITAANADPQLSQANKQYSLKAKSGPRFWRPNDPVLLLARPGSSKNGVPSGLRDPRAVLDCPTIKAGSLDPDNPTGGALMDLQDRVAGLYRDKRLPVSVWRKNPWQPFLLEWEVALIPAGRLGNLLTRNRSYAQDYVDGHYQLDESAADFRLLPSFDVITSGHTLYAGLSILTPNAGIKLETDLRRYLLDWVKADLPERYFEQAGTAPENRGYGYLLRDLAGFGAWVGQEISDLQDLPDADDPELDAGMESWWRDQLETLLRWYAGQKAESLPAAMRNLLAAFRQLESWECLAQSLGGFNEALLMHKQTRQLEIADPIGFPEYQDFTDRVREAVGRNTTAAAQPLNDFMPLRSGYMEVRALRLVDNFGQVQDIRVHSDEVLTSEPLRDAAHPGRIQLRPRLSQAARLNLRWLSAHDDGQETSEHPDSNPICGWLIPNYLDNSLDVYDAFGQPVGALVPDPDVPWRSAPADPFPTTVEQIENRHLRRVVQFLYERHRTSLNPELGAASERFLADFLDVLESAQETIDPESAARHPDLALLMGRPIAVARVNLDLQLLGEPAQHQGWNLFIKQLQGADADTDNFDRVEFPVRLGEPHQLNDGLLGYWSEDVDGGLDRVFCSPVASTASHPGIRVYRDGGPPLNVPVTVNAPARAFTLLFDPRGKLHATSGILPTKEIDIPTELYGPALQHIEVTFQMAPLLSDAGKIRIDLPNEPGFSWSWLERTGPVQWREIPRTPTIGRALLEEKIPEPTDLWRRLTRGGWLAPSGDRPDTARVVPKDQRPDQPPAGLSPTLLADVERVFDTYSLSIGAAVSTAAFSAPQAIREGWLKLGPDPASADSDA
ncbi:hypothetical protein [Halomonas cerina]|uniref:Uncharacterized protein n=1 Tax=Halomonas cerina TaxID=447424 RepID=A0A839VB22_9GAMM|nr:hypothetical protein [Halomonas cerina]MBB3190619.1 hypothetical protein [Halomonas cerina]